MRNKLILSLLCAAVLTGCGEYNKVLKSSDTNYKYEYAKKAFEERKYVQAATLLEDVVKVLKGTDKAEELLYLLGLSHYEDKDYASASRELRRLPETSARTPHSLSRLTISRHSNPQTASKKKSQNNMDYEENEYGENAVDNMMVDYDYHVNTGELPKLFDESSVDNFIANLNDWD